MQGNWMIRKEVTQQQVREVMTVNKEHQKNTLVK